MKFYRSAVAVAALGGLGIPACAQSSATVYGVLDLSVDSVHKSEGNVQGTVFGLSGATPLPNAKASPGQTLTRVANSLTAQSHIGFKGTEDLGQGWKAKFQLESSVAPDTGTIGTDGRMFGRAAWVGVTTPAGEVRLGHQAAPMVAAYYLNSLQRLGTTDLLAAGVTVNNLQMYQDNVISYALQSGPWIGQLSYSPNAGVASRISAARSIATSSSPPATATTGQIVGGATSGVESDTQRGRTMGALASYQQDDFTWVASYHRNDFDAPVGLATAAGGFVPLMSLKAFQSWMTGAKFRFTPTDTLAAFNLYQGRFTDDSRTDPKVRVIALALKQTVGQLDLSLQGAQLQFTNFTKGKDLAFMLGADYNLSKRTALYVRAGQLKDIRGNVTQAPLTRVGLAGGPAVLLLPLGSLEIPYFSGAGANMESATRLVGFGIRHSF